MNPTRLTPSTAVAEADDAATAVLCARIKAGDEAEFTRFYHDWFGRMLGAARRLTGRDESFCMDVVQEAMLKAVHKLPALTTCAALEAWVMAAVRTSAIDRLRKELRRAAREQGRGGHASPGPRDQESESLRALLRTLGEDERELLELRIARGHQLGVIASLLSTTTNAVHGRVRRILAKLGEQGRNGDE
ncbi:MAG: RNA polymerase sigma factor [Phycisphaerales bacterium]